MEEGVTPAANFIVFRVLADLSRIYGKPRFMAQSHTDCLPLGGVCVPGAGLVPHTAALPEASFGNWLSKG